MENIELKSFISELVKKFLVSYAIFSIYFVLS